MKYPKTNKISQKDVYGNNHVLDDYAWLNNLDDKETKNWLNTQHSYTDKYFKDSDALEKRKRYLKEKAPLLNIRSLKYQHNQYVGVIDDPKKGLQAFVSKDLKDFKILQTQGKPYTSIFGCEFSETDPNTYIFTGYYEDETRVSINLVKDEKVIDRFGFGFDQLLTKDGKYVYYAHAKTNPSDHTKSMHDIYRYDIKNESKEKLYTFEQDAVVVYFEESDDEVLVMIDTNYHDTKLLKIDQKGHVTHLTGVLNKSLSYAGKIDDHLYFVSDEKDDKQHIIYFNLKEGYENRKVLNTLSAYAMEAKVKQDKIIVFYKQDAEDMGKILDKEGKILGDVPLPSDYASIYIVGESDDTLYLNFNSVFVPPSILAYDVKNNTVEVIKNISEEKKADDLVVEKRSVILRDKQTSVLYLVYHQDHKPTEKSPLIMYGYGGYGVTQSLEYFEPMTHYSLHDWCSNGGVYVNVILRGGGEYGKAWHDEGKLENKQNTFNDLYDMTEYLHKHKISTPAKTVLGGASNGGLLVSAAFTQRPDLYTCIIDGIGLHDMLHFVKDPRGSMYQTEYGNPYDQTMFEVLKAYSPYHNLKENVDYPSIYIHVGMLDTNVPPYHGMKFAAKAQALNPSGNPILLRVLEHGHHDFGHGDEQILTLAERQCFIEKQLNIGVINK